MGFSLPLPTTLPIPLAYRTDGVATSGFGLQPFAPNGNVPPAQPQLKNSDFKRSYALSATGWTGVSGVAAPWQQPPRVVKVVQSPAGNPIYYAVLGNGHRVLLDCRDSDLIAVRTYVGAGSGDENPLFPSRLYPQTTLPPGIAHLDEHNHFLTTQHFPQPNSWVRTVEGYGAQLNASTGYEYIQHELIFNKHDLPDMLALHGEAVLRPLYQPQHLFQEQRNVINEASERMQSPEAQIYSKGLELIFERPHYQSLGRPSDVNGTTVGQLQQFYNTFYTPTNMLTVVSGNIPPQQVSAVLDALDKSFGRNPAQGFRNPNGLHCALRPGEVRKATYFDPQLTYSSQSYYFPAPSRSNFKDRIALDCLMTLMGDGPMSILPRVLRDQTQLATNLNLEYMPMKTTGMTELSFHTKPGQESAAQEATLSLLRQLGEQSVSPQQLDAARSKLFYRFQRSLNDTDWVNSHLGGEALGNSLRYFIDYPQLLAQVTPQDLQRVARQYFSPDTYALVEGRFGPQRGFSQTLTSRPELPPVDPSTLCGLYNDLPVLDENWGTLPDFRPQAVTAQAVAGLGSPAASPVLNGAQGYFQQAPGRLQSTVSLILPLGPSQPEARIIVPTLVMEGSKAAKQLIEKCQAQGIDLDFDLVGDNLALSAVGPVGKESEMMRAAIQLLKSTDYDQSEFSSAFKAKIQTLMEAKNHPATPLKESVQKALFGPNHPYAYSVQEVLDRVTHPDANLTGLNAFSDLIEHPEKMTVFMVSPEPVAQQQALVNAAIQQTGWLATGTPTVPGFDSPPLSPARGTAGPLLVPSEHLKRVKVEEAWRAPNVSDPDYLPFMLLTRVLSGMSGSFFRILRTENGLVYSTKQRYTSHLEGGSFKVHADIDPEPDKVRRALQGFDQAVADVTTHPVSEADLKRAKEEFLLAVNDAKQSAEGIAGLDLPWIAHQQTPINVSELEARINAISSADLLRVARHVFGPDGYRVIGLSAPKKVLESVSSAGALSPAPSASAPL
jgi:predicted Zn-dependent peptidase